MKTIFSPKELADAIGVSESSLRRWIDDGKIPTSKTVGGHRRIALADAVRFVRESHATVVRPELLGLSELRRRQGDLAEDDRKLEAALVAGDVARARSLVLSWYLAGRSIPSLFDNPIRVALHNIGELWQHSDQGILIEHRAVDVCLQVLNQLRDLVPPPAPQAPVALGAAPAGDPYLIPTMMASIVLADVGYLTINFGPEVPVPLLLEAARAHRARLVWVSISTDLSLYSLKDQIEALARDLAELGSRLVIGGRVSEPIRNELGDLVTGVRSMEELAAAGRRIGFGGG